MEHWICTTCGTQFDSSERQPEYCPICTDERQYVGQNGQHWTTLKEMHSAGYRNAYRLYEPGLIGIGTTPSFAIGQRALLVQTPKGNILWDCISYIDDITVDLIRGIGGISAIAISHPHYYSAMVEWANRFDCPIYLHADDEQWIMRKSERIHLWQGETLPLIPGVTLMRLGGHFRGGTVLHWQAGTNGKGVLLSGDIVQVVADRNWVSFMYSYPNDIPLPAHTVSRIRDKLRDVQFDRIYGAWFDAFVETDGNRVVERSAERYIRALEGRM